jgi:Sel1 repeat
MSIGACLLVDLFLVLLHSASAEGACQSLAAATRQKALIAGVPAAHGRLARSIATASDGVEYDSQELSALNLLGTTYARGNGVRKDREAAMRLLLRASLQGYTPAMVNLGTLYEIRAGRADLPRAYVWLRTALWFGVPEQDHEETMSKLLMTAARLSPHRLRRAERLSDMLVSQIIESCRCVPGLEPEMATEFR